MANTPDYSEEEKYKIALARVRKWCASEEHCLWDGKQKLARLGCTSSETGRILQLLTEEGFINEARYAQSFAKGKFNLFKWGKNKIASAMRMKKIPEQYIAEALDNLDTDAYQDSLIALLNKKKRELTGETPMGMKRKLVRFALQKGFEAEIVYAALRMTTD